MAFERKKSLRPGTARTLVGVFLLAGILLGVFDAPGRWNSFVNQVSGKTGAGFISYLQLRSPVLRPFRLGLDVQGGTHLVYQADLKNIAPSEQGNSMEAVRDVIERRVNLFGVAEPLIQLDQAGKERRLIVELAGIRDVGAAIRLIGATPYLEFKEERSAEERDAILADIKKGGARKDEDPYFSSTGLTGRHVKKAVLDFSQTTYEPVISLELTGDGGKLFGEITKRSIGKHVAIYLDGSPISVPVVREEITGGRAQISGGFTPDSAKELVGRLNAGALPVPITLVAQQSVGASLGQESLAKSINAGVIGFLFVALFMIFWYRLPGVLAVLALLLYVSIVLSIFKLIPVTLTAAGIAGFILSMGMAVDANILIFERLKEELRSGKGLEDAIGEGFARAWTSIRDSNVSSLITSSILYWMGTSIVQGFALTLSIGIVISMFSAISVTRTLLIAMSSRRLQNWRVLFMSGLTR